MTRIKAIRAAGFTLVELLVVVAILAILASILFPVFSRAKITALQTQSLSQIRQIGLAWTLYAGDYDDTLMPPRTARGGQAFAYWWAGFDHATGVRDDRGGLLFPYSRSPEIQADPLWPDTLREAIGYTGYGYNYRYLGTGRVRTTQITQPSRTVAFATSARLNFMPPYQLQGNTYLEPPSSRYPTFQARAHGQGLIVWADTHVSRWSPRDRNESIGGATAEAYRAAGIGEIDEDGDWTTDELFDLN